MFLTAVVLVVLFAEGYQYDAGSRDMVKKSVIYFESLPADSEFILNSKKVDDFSSKEIRVDAGNHLVELKKNGYSSWIKNVKVPENAVVKFKPIKLFPSDISKSSFKKPLQKMAGFEIVKTAEDGVLLFNKNLHFFKFFDFSGDFWIKELVKNDDASGGILPVDKTPPQKLPAGTIWAEQIDESGNKLFIKNDLDLLYCDSDFENCSFAAKLDSPFFAKSKSLTAFIGMSGGNLILFDFGEQSLLQRFLDNFGSPLSAVF